MRLTIGYWMNPIITYKRIMVKRQCINGNYKNGKEVVGCNGLTGYFSMGPGLQLA